MKKPLAVGILSILTAGATLAFMGCNSTNSCQCVQTDFYCVGADGGTDCTFCGWSCNTDCFQCSYYPFLTGCYARDWYSGDSSYADSNYCHNCTGCWQCDTKGSSGMCAVFGVDMWNFTWAEGGTEYGYNSRYEYKQAKYRADYEINNVYLRFVGERDAIVTVDWTAYRPICAGYFFVTVGNRSIRIPIGYIDANDNVVFREEYIVSPGQHYLMQSFVYDGISNPMPTTAYFDQGSSSAYYFVEK